MQQLICCHFYGFPATNHSLTVISDVISVPHMICWRTLAFDVLLYQATSACVDVHKFTLLISSSVSCELMMRDSRMLVTLSVRELSVPYLGQPTTFSIHGNIYLDQIQFVHVIYLHVIIPVSLLSVCVSCLIVCNAALCRSAMDDTRELEVCEPRSAGANLFGTGSSWFLLP